MEKYITYQDKIDELILDARHPQSRNKIFVLVEGIDDVKLYPKFFNEFCKIEPIPGGVTKLENSLTDIPRHVKRINLLAIRDADFMHIENKQAIFSNLFLTDTHDSETMLIANDETLSAVIYEFLPYNSLPINDLRIQFLQAVEFLGYLRWYNNLNNFEFNFRGLSVNKLLDVNAKFTIKRIELIKEIVKRSPNKHFKDEITIIQEVENLFDSSYSLLQICCGHDVIKVIAAYFTSFDKSYEVNDRTVVSHLRTAYHLSHFKQSELFRKLSLYAQQKKLYLF